jgi:organic radical activating enzyme
MPFCNLACSWCDTEYNSFKTWTDEELISFANQEKARFAVITGGEPMMHKHTQLVIDLLLKEGFELACETNGTFPIKPGIYFPTVSPKRDAEYKIHPHAFENAAEFKYVIDQGFPWEVLKRHNVLDGRRYSLSPEFGRFHESLAEIQEYIKHNPGWRISLQTHKWANIK